MKTFCLIGLALFLSGCDWTFGNVSATEPIERGLSYVATAIIIAAFIRGIMNK